MISHEDLDAALGRQGLAHLRLRIQGRDDARRFRAAWEEGNDVTDVRAAEIDAVLSSIII
jgi:hypothetical protein